MKKWLSHEDIIKSRLLFMYYYFTDLPIFVFSAFLFLTDRPTAYFHERWLTFMGDGNEEFYRDGLSVNTCENVIDTRVCCCSLCITSLVRNVLSCRGVLVDLAPLK